jgi:8-oxo-dGTP pyrophosphatase MutT (NUDIX family)
MDHARTRVLLTLHPKVGRWLQMGGHLEPGDATLRDAALREAREESGIDEIEISEFPLRLDRHRVRCAADESTHLDVQFLGLVAPEAQEVISEESDDLRWFTLDDLPADLDDSVRALITAALSA